jgi:hypothetical protein
MKTLFKTMLLLAVSTATFAQTALFSVLASKGDVKISSNGESKPMLIGKKLFAHESIVVGQGAYLGLASTSGKTIEIKRPGTYEVSKLSAEVSSQNASASKKYLDFLSGEVSGNSEDMAKNKYKYMKVTGSVERGASDITIYSPSEVTVIASKVKLFWELNKHVNTYQIKVMNIFDEVIVTKETTSNNVELDLAALNLAKEKNLFVLISSKEHPNVKSNKVNLKYNEEINTKLGGQAKELKTELSEETALNNYVLANFYSENNLPLNAIECYENANQLEPEVEIYQYSLGEYLNKQGITK